MPPSAIQKRVDYRRIMAEAVVVIDIRVSGKAAEHRLPELRRQGVAIVLTSPHVGQHLPGHLGQAKGIIQFPEREQPGIGCGPLSMELQLEAAVESAPQIARVNFTRHSLHDQPIRSPAKH